MEYWCRICGRRELSVGDFYPPQLGVTGRGECKECTKERVRRRRATDGDATRAYDRERAKLPHRKAMSKRRHSEFSEKFPRAIHAQSLVHSAVGTGHLKRTICECGHPQTVAHHDDYLKPLVVRWMCQSCHIRWHLQNGPGLNKEGPVEKKPRGYWKRMLATVGASAPH